jgi:hypothetical protein
MPESIVPSGYFGTGPENIHIIENFLSKELCQEIHDFLKIDKVWDGANIEWNKKVLPSPLFQDTDFYPELTQKRDELIEIIEKIYNVKINKDFQKISLVLVRWDHGATQAAHGDRENKDGTLKPKRIRDYDISSVLYLNDDFDGGNTYFTQHDISVKPKQGSVVIFPGDRYYIHGVSEVQNGTRFTVPKFWTVDQIV